MSYLNPKLQKQIAEKLGMHYLSADSQVMYTKRFDVSSYWAAYMTYRVSTGKNERKIEWLIAAVKSSLWHRGLIASVDGLNSNLLKVAGVPLQNWDDPILNHLRSVDVMPLEHDGYLLDGDLSYLELVFGTFHSQGSFSVGQFPTDNPNLDGLWRKLREVTAYFRILAKPEAFKTNEIFRHGIHNWRKKPL